MNRSLPSEADPSRGPAPDPFDNPVQHLHQRAIEMLRTQHYSPRTVKSYGYWISRYLEFHAGTHSRFLREAAVNAFLSHLAVEKDVAAPTQNQALSALIYLYANVLRQPLDQVEGVIRARRPKRVPVVLTPSEVEAVLSQMYGVPKLVTMLLYGSGMRLSEGLSIRVKDIDFARRELVVRGGKGAKDRVTMLPDCLQGSLREHLRGVREQHRADLQRGLGRVILPNALARKYPNADREWGWQWVFPATSHYLDPKTGIRHRHHLHQTVIQKAIREAVSRSGISKHVTAHTFRHSFATQLLVDRYDIRTIQELMGHRDVRTTQIYTHVLNRGGYGVRSPLDGLDPKSPPKNRGLY